MRKVLTTAMLATVAIVGSATSTAAAPKPPTPPTAPDLPNSPHRGAAYSSDYAYAESGEEKSILNLTNPVAPAFDLLTVNGEKKSSVAASGNVRSSSK